MQTFFGWPHGSEAAVAKADNAVIFAEKIHCVPGCPRRTCAMGGVLVAVALGPSRLSRILDSTMRGIAETLKDRIHSFER